MRQSAGSAGEAVSEAGREESEGAREESPMGRQLTRATLVSHLTFTSELGSGPYLRFYADLSLSLSLSLLYHSPCRCVCLDPSQQLFSLSLSGPAVGRRARKRRRRRRRGFAEDLGCLQHADRASSPDEINAHFCRSHVLSVHSGLSAHARPMRRFD